MTCCIYVMRSGDGLGRGRIEAEVHIAFLFTLFLRLFTLFNNRVYQKILWALGLTLCSVVFDRANFITIFYLLFELPLASSRPRFVDVFEKASDA